MLRGYTALRGTSIMHIPMLVAHLAVVRVPGARNENEVDYYPEAEVWYWFAAFMHILMAVLHILGFYEARAIELYVECARILSVILQILNLIIIA